MKLLTYFHTLKYLKPGQFYHRVARRLVKPKVRTVVWQKAPVQGDWLGVALYQQKFFPEGKVCFLNTVGQIASPSDWNQSDQSKLWLYNLHYFDDLNAENADQRRTLQLELVERWVSENPPGSGNGWEPYPLSLRIVNWVKASLSGAKLSEAAQESLAKQAEYLSQDLEKHILGNHLFANAKALIFAGLYFQGEYAERWLKIGLDIISAELEEQVLADGGNFELSPMYHEIMLVDLLDLLNVTNAYPGRVTRDKQQAYERSALKMMTWLQNMRHPDGEISFFNDAAFGIAPPPALVLDYASGLGLTVPKAPAEHLLTMEDSGYSRINMPAHCVLFDHASVGPDYLPGHAHADSLSFEWSVGKQRVLVNSGTSVYGKGQERQRQRGTAAHNTVLVDGYNSSEVWDGFRVARRAYCKLVDTFVAGENTVIAASHDGYCRINPALIHQRRLSACPHTLQVEDELGLPGHDAVAIFHLHPDIKVVETCKYYVKLAGTDGMPGILVESDGEIRVEDSTWHPQFGCVCVNSKLVIPFPGAKLTTRFHLDGIV